MNFEILDLINSSGVPGIRQLDFLY